MKFTILDRDEAGHALARPHGFTHLVSLNAFHNELPPASWRLIGKESDALVLFFDDISYEAPNAPRRKQVVQILAFGAKLPKDAHTLVHCRAGISRSTAAAYMILAQALGPGYESEAFSRIAAARFGLYPNALMVQYADDTLARGGKLVNACKDGLKQLYG